MKKITLLIAILFYCVYAIAQVDSTIVSSKKSDTIRIGNILIIKKGGKKNKDNASDSTDNQMVTVNNQGKNNSRITTNWWIVDLGFANYSDQTDYTNTGSYLVNNPATGVPAISSSDFKLKAGKSVNVNIWFFMQKINLIKQNVSIKYGLGLELNNYRYKSGITYKESGMLPYGGPQTNMPFVFRQDSIAFSKNKLAADYLTIPIMLNFASTPSDNKKGITLSAGVSAGYLYSQRNKQKSDAFGEQKNKGEYDLEKFKISYIAELGLGPIRLYGSYSTKSMYERGLDIRPYTFGFRISNL
ncbi:MAG: outer membrane beta-barrel protein [Ferruginibacter sp.]